MTFRCGDIVLLPFPFTDLSAAKHRPALLVKQVPAEICENCGEEFINETTSVQLLSTAETAIHNGVQVELRQFAVA